jgi:hypothetical protein
MCVIQIMSVNICYQRYALLKNLIELVENLQKTIMYSSVSDIDKNLLEENSLLEITTLK